jgi:putative ATPase
MVSRVVQGELLPDEASEHAREDGVPWVSTPLAARMRPRTLDEYVGQEHLIGPGRALRRAIEADALPSMILWGPPGSGKTTLAEVIANSTACHFVALSAVTAGVADLRREVEAARKALQRSQRTVLFIDEIHRFNKAQQDTILPHVERGTIRLIGATTENPSFEVNSALLSRAQVFTLQALTDAEIELILRRALADTERGLGRLRADLDDASLAWLVTQANGDARTALNALELAVAATSPDDQGRRHVDQPTLQETLQRRSLQYDRAGDQHYDTISAFIKSIRGSDPDAAVYWLARMLDAGEDLMFVARRLVVLASEDVGLADPAALPLAVAAQQAAHLLGLPEALYPLTEVTLYLALAPKSNTVKTTYFSALEDVQQTRADPVPLHLRNAVTSLMRGLGYGREYRYAHDYPEGRVQQQHLPDNLAGRRYFQPNPRDRSPQPAASGSPLGSSASHPARPPDPQDLSMDRQE